MAEGAHVVIGDINMEKGAALAAELGSNATATELDVRNSEHWEAAFERASTLGELTTLVNSAGVSIPGSIEDINLDQFRTTLSINLEGVFLGCKYAVDAMKTGAGGSIINVGSTLGVRSGAIFPAYSASKGAVRLLSRSIALHCAAQGYDIRVNTLIPGAIHTEMVEGYIEAGKQAGQSRDQVFEGLASVHPMRRMGTATETADAIVFLASDESSFTTGADLPVDGGYLA